MKKQKRRVERNFRPIAGTVPLVRPAKELEQRRIKKTNSNYDTIAEREMDIGDKLDRLIEDYNYK